MSTRKVRFPARAILAASLFLGCGAVGWAQDDVTWVRDVAEPAGRAGLRVPCGNYGVFHFNIAGFPANAPEPIPAPEPVPHPENLCQNQEPGCQSGREIPAYYPAAGPGGLVLPMPVPVSPAPAPFPATIATTSSNYSGSSSASSLSSDKRAGDVTRKSAWTPCFGGACFDTVGTGSGAHPWVAVIDWDDPHGWSVGWTLRQVLGQHPGADPQHDYDLALLSFLTPPLQAFSGKGVTDVHVLAKLCDISEAVDRGGVRPPFAVNMSFGRYFRGAPKDWDRGTLCQSDALSCQIVRVLEHLYRAPSGPGTGTVLVAAAGNHRSVQFPAAVETVNPVGGLDIEVLASQQVSKALWETAPELTGLTSRARALFPASGLCLESVPGQTGSPSWAAPPGTSYSSALLAGWLALELADGTVLDPLLPELWSLKRTCVSGSCTYQLMQGSQRPYGPHASTDYLFRRLFDPGSRVCGQPPAQGDPTLIASVPSATSPDPTLTLPSFLQVLSGWELPSPGSNPCIPCAGLGGPPPKRVGFDPTKIDPNKIQIIGVIDAVPLDWTIDFSENGRFVDGMVLESIYVRSGNAFRKIAISSADLAVVQSGKLKGIYLAGAGAYVQPNSQASLVFVLHRGTDTAKPFWTSIPVYFP